MNEYIKQAENKYQEKQKEIAQLEKQKKEQDKKIKLAEKSLQDTRHKVRLGLYNTKNLYKKVDIETLVTSFVVFVHILYSKNNTKPLLLRFPPWRLYVNNTKTQSS